MSSLLMGLLSVAEPFVERIDERPAFDSRIDIAIEECRDGLFQSSGWLKPLTKFKKFFKKGSSLEMRIGEKLVVPGFSINLRERKRFASGGDGCSNNMSWNELRAAIKSGKVKYRLTQKENKLIFNMLQNGQNKVAFYDKVRPTLKVDALIYRWSWNSTGHTHPGLNGALDIVMVEDDAGSVKNTGLFVSVSNSSKCLRKAERTTDVKIRNKGDAVPFFSIKLNRLRQKSSQGMPIEDLTPQENKQIFEHLDEGMNEITFYIEGHPDSEIDARIYKLRRNSKVVIVDIDGTITKSIVNGIWENFKGKGYYQPGICELLWQIKLQGYEILYLTARPVSTTHATRRLLADKLEENFEMPPPGPVITCCYGRLHSTLHYVGVFFREKLGVGLIFQWCVSHEDFKTELLSKINTKVFEGEVGSFAGFGDTKSDFKSYESAGIPGHRNFRVKKGAIQSGVKKSKSCFDDKQKIPISKFPVDLHFPNNATIG